MGFEQEEKRERKKKKTFSVFPQALGREQLCRPQELGLGTKDSKEDKSQCLAASGFRVKVTLAQESAPKQGSV